MIGKFKVWDVKMRIFLEKEWPYFIDQDGDLCFVIKGSAVKCSPSETIPIFSTGKTDKNGVELWRGDWVKCLLISGHEIRTIIFEKGETLVLNIKTGASGHMNAGHFYEKIGNKFENPELMETK